MMTPAKRWYDKHQPIVRAAARASYRADPRAKFLERAKRRATRDGMICELTVEDIVIPSLCPVLGIPIQIATGKPNDNSPSLDRIDNRLGYTSSNVRVISYRANRIKNDATLEEMQAVVRYMQGG